MRLGDIMRKVTSLAAKNPDKVRRAIDQVEGQVDRRTGGKYTRQVNRAGDELGKRLGARRQNPDGQNPGGQNRL